MNTSGFIHRFDRGTEIPRASEVEVVYRMETVDEEAGLME